MTEREERLAGVLERAHHVHAVVAERTNGVDPDWALFYAWWLVKWSDLPDILGSTPALGELTARLITLDAAYRTEARQEPWPTFYARGLLASPT
jgi:hypothetical protein